jgi:hypothetical protein
MPQQPSVPQEWVERLNAFQAFTSAAELEKSHPPPHRIAAGEMEIWHYPLGVLAGTLYSIHVAVSANAAPMAYMHMKPSSAADTAKGKRPWWPFW